MTNDQALERMVVIKPQFPPILHGLQVKGILIVSILNFDFFPSDGIASGKQWHDFIVNNDAASTTKD